MDIHIPMYKRKYIHSHTSSVLFLWCSNSLLPYAYLQITDPSVNCTFDPKALALIICSVTVKYRDL